MRLPVSPRRWEHGYESTGRLHHGSLRWGLGNPSFPVTYKLDTFSLNLCKLLRWYGKRFTRGLLKANGKMHIIGSFHSPTNFLKSSGYFLFYRHPLIFALALLAGASLFSIRALDLLTPKILLALKYTDLFYAFFYSTLFYSLTHLIFTVTVWVIFIFLLWSWGI